MTCNFGNKIRSSNESSSHQHMEASPGVVLQSSNGGGQRKLPMDRNMVQSMDMEISPKHRVLTTDLPESDIMRPLDSARNRLISSNNEDREFEQKINFPISSFPKGTGVSL